MKRLLSGAYILGYSDARNDKAIDPIGAIERLTMNLNKSDLISRQDALNCINKLYAGHTACNMFEALDAVAEYIEQLPSAEPRKILFGSCLEYSGISNLLSAEPEIIRCKDCKHWLTRNGGYCEIWEWYISNDAFYCGCGARMVSEDAE